MLSRKNCQELYPEYFFCHNCTEWETHSLLGMKGKGSHPSSLPCTANHTSYIFPSTIRHMFNHHKHSSNVNENQKIKKPLPQLVSPTNLSIDDIMDEPDVPIDPTDSGASDGILLITLEN
jgi:hypothetical protein